MSKKILVLTEAATATGWLRPSPRPRRQREMK